MTKQSDLTNLTSRLDEFVVAAEKARGNSATLVKAAPLEIHLYNIATRTKRELNEFKALIDDFQGTYLSDRESSNV